MSIARACSSLLVLHAQQAQYATCALVFLASALAFGPILFDEKSALAENSSNTDAARIVLVAEESEYDYMAVSAELPASKYIGIALHDLERARDPSTESDKRPVVLEESSCPSEGWPAAALHGPSLRTGNAPMATSTGSGDCKCKTKLGDTRSKRLAALYVNRKFSLPTGVVPKDYDFLSLRIAYRDGVKAYLNGQLIASRNMQNTPASASDRVRGPEWEEFILPLPGGLLTKTNLLSIELRPARLRNGVRFDAELSLQKASALARGPLLQQVRETSAIVSFDTHLPVAAKVLYGTSAQLGKQALSAGASLARHHQVKLTGLSPGQVVHYQVVFAGGATEVLRFHVPPPREKVLHFAVYGDMRGGHRIHAQIVSALQAELIDFVIVTGDLVLRGSDEADWQRFFAVAQPLLARLPFYPVAGNHDRGSSGDEARRMKEIFVMWPGPTNRPAGGHWHSFEQSGVHFVMLDSNHYRNSDQLAWLEKDLKSARKRGVRAIFAAVHAGPYSRGLHRGNSYAEEHYAPLLRKYGVSILFSGHDHLYQRGEVAGLPYMVSGGGGAPLYSVRCGIKGKPRCKKRDGMQHVAKEYHYILISVFPKFVRACPKRIDRTPLEACIRYKLD
ncbi:MAG: metallophosphoesterase family protein [Kofleriaceae bacterium]|nr:metallophosphoesterase family protein [Kofleriaceae bacterium]